MTLQRGELDPIADAYWQDTHDQQRINNLQHTITTFLNDPPDRLTPDTREQLERARDRLKARSAHITAVWD